MTDPSASAPRFTGRLLMRGEPGFEDARVDRVFNRRLPARQPAAILLAETDEDVVAGVRLARERGWRVAVRSGGHSWAQWSIREDALIIDLGRFREISYDKPTEIVTVTGSVQGGLELDPFLAKRGRFFNGGHCPAVGVGGFILQGGQGWNARGWGWAAERLMAVDAVTADGQLVHADSTQNADLLWAARGAGPGFPGVVTRFHLHTLPRPAHLAHTIQVYPVGLFDDVMTWLQGMHHTVADTVEIVAVAMTPPRPDGTARDEAAPVLAVTALAFTDDHAQALEALAPFEASPLLDRALHRQHAKPTTLAEQQAEQLRANPEGHRWRVDNAWLRGTPAEVVPAIRRACTELPNGQSFTIWFSMAPLRELPDMAFSLQTDAYLATYVLWREEADDFPNREWVAARMRDMQTVTAGQYLGDGDLSGRQVKFMDDSNWACLQDIRALRDPAGLFVSYLAGPDGASNENHWQARPDAPAHRPC